MTIVLDTGSLLIDLALTQLLSCRGHRALAAIHTRPDFSPDFVLVGNNFDCTATISIFPDAKVLVLDVDLSAPRYAEAISAGKVDAILPRSANQNDFEKEAARILTRQGTMRSVLRASLRANVGPFYN